MKESFSLWGDFKLKIETFLLMDNVERHKWNFLLSALYVLLGVMYFRENVKESECRSFA